MNRYLGDALGQTSAWGEAVLAYQRAVQLLMVTDGPSEPFSRCAAEKLGAWWQP